MNRLLAHSTAAAAALLPLVAGCAAPNAAAPAGNALGFGRPVDHLIQPGEAHFEHLWKLTSGGENAEGYFSFAGDRLSFQRTEDPIPCDRIFVTLPGGGYRQISSGEGVTTCAHFLPGDEEVLFASTQAVHRTCPPRPDYSMGYAWKVYPEYDIYVHDLATGAERLLIGGDGYDAEATVSPVGDRMVFTSTRSGDLELWTSDLDGGNLHQVTDALGYDGGAFFSHDGEWLVYRRTQFTPGQEAEEQATYEELLAQWLVRPQAMELWICRADGSDARQVTTMGGASWAPYFFPNDDRIIFATNHHDPGTPALNFDLFAIDVDGTDLERITYYDDHVPGRRFDAFPMFSPDGEWLVFASNRGAETQGETNLFLAKWKD